MMHCAIWYHLYNLKNVKNNHGGVLLLVTLQAKACNLLKVTLLMCVFHVFYIVQMVSNRVKHLIYPLGWNKNKNKSVATYSPKVLLLISKYRRLFSCSIESGIARISKTKTSKQKKPETKITKTKLSKRN